MTKDERRRQVEDTVLGVVAGADELTLCVLYAHLHALGYRVSGIERAIEKHLNEWWSTAQSGA